MLTHPHSCLAPHSLAPSQWTFQHPLAASVSRIATTIVIIGIVIIGITLHRHLPTHLHLCGNPRFRLHVHHRRLSWHITITALIIVHLSAFAHPPPATLISAPSPLAHCPLAARCYCNLLHILGTSHIGTRGSDWHCTTSTVTSRPVYSAGSSPDAHLCAVCSAPAGVCICYIFASAACAYRCAGTYQ